MALPITAQFKVIAQQRTEAGNNIRIKRTNTAIVGADGVDLAGSAPDVIDINGVDAATIQAMTPGTLCTMTITVP
jgi:hypothetical protein